MVKRFTGLPVIHSLHSWRSKVIQGSFEIQNILYNLVLSLVGRVNCFMHGELALTQALKNDAYEECKECRRKLFV